MRLGSVKMFWVPQPPLNPSLLTSRPIYSSLGTEPYCLKLGVETFRKVVTAGNTPHQRHEGDDCFKPQVVSHFTVPDGKSEYRH
ncbi:hypothetical protein GT037_005168 [Alternaria burnsii]|uniref:Uncharacterized protein n=1 Tax=Alternaria burnsii TaxID=1187904 RepID=A0A8H7EEL3_9PLEO|nr:uncharacterized protein GT037_005168 [Alternaria burnsii]KAF7676956.1 hypothetical protein GT037_005168 [Alternaria burnsii]